MRNGVGVTAPVLSDGAATYTPGVGERRGSTTKHYGADLKNEVAQVSTMQTISASKQYDAFGNVTSSSGTFNGPFSYGGKFGYQTDSDTSYQLLGHRYYDPSTGRFLTRDPIGDGENWYAYCAGNPLTSTDPSGLITLEQVSDFFAGWGDALTSGGLIPMITGKPLTRSIREMLGVDDVVDYGSGEYAFGDVIGQVHMLALEVVISAEAGKLGGTPQVRAVEGGAPPSAPSPVARTKRISTAKSIKDYEEYYGTKWPKDPESGRNKVVAHTKALADGGTNHPTNIKPMTKSAHIKSHIENGDFKRWGGRSKGSVRKNK